MEIKLTFEDKELKKKVEYLRQLFLNDFDDQVVKDKLQQEVNRKVAKVGARRRTKIFQKEIHQWEEALIMARLCAEYDITEINVGKLK